MQANMITCPIEFLTGKTIMSNKCPIGYATGHVEVPYRFLYLIQNMILHNKMPY